MYFFSSFERKGTKMVRKLPCIALIADVVESKKIKERGYFQQQLGEKLREINEKRGSQLLSPYTITLGDEFQAVYAHYDTVLGDIWEIADAVYPHRIRFALGYGKLTTAINPRQAIGMDGPAFYAARTGINRLKDIDRMIIQLEGEGITHKNLFNESLCLLSLYQDKWKERTHRTFWGLQNGQSVEELSHLSIDRETISERAVYKQIHTHHLNEYVSMLTVLTEFLTSLHE